MGGYAAAMTRVLQHRSLRDKLGGMRPELAQRGYTGVKVTHQGILLTRDGAQEKEQDEDQVEECELKDLPICY